MRWLGRAALVCVACALPWQIATAAPKKKPAPKSATRPPPAASSASATPEETKPPAGEVDATPVAAMPSSSPEPAAPVVASSASAAAPPAEDDREARWSSSVVVVGVEGGSEGRRFRYGQPLTGNLRPYDLAAAPLAAIDLVVTPFAWTAVPVLRQLGLHASAAGVFGLSSEREGVRSRNERWAYGFGARLRTSWPARVLVAFEADYRVSSFVFGDEPAPPLADAPSVRYRLVRGGVSARLPVSAVRLLLGGGGGPLLGLGALGDRFPHAKGGSVDAFVGVSLPVFSAVDLTLRLVYERVFLSLHPDIGAPYVAGGALDQLFGARLGFQVAR
jgi:hypothetical protein